MRTTVELKPEHRSALLALAARRGEKGLAGVLRDAIESYLRGEVGREEQNNTFQSLAGVLSEEGADALEINIQELRANWR